MNTLLSGNEALAQGAFEAGVTAAFGYPGTPSTEILENLVKFASEGVYCEWSPNEKVALEAAAGAAIAGARSLVTMKCVGLNVAADPLMTLAYTGVVGGMVVIVADDPGQHSSQTEQDTRHYARLAKIPIFEPANAQECRDFIVAAFQRSEADQCPVILRTTTCVSHSRSLVSKGTRLTPPSAHFVKNDPRFVPLPLWGRKLRVQAEERLARQSIAASEDALFNVVLPGSDSRLGIIASGAPALHAREIFPTNPMLKLGWAFPFPDALIQSFAASVEKVLIIEEVDPILEEHVRSLGIPCIGKEVVPRCGELTPAQIEGVRAQLAGTPAQIPQPVAEAADLPGRPPILCPGCPHRGLFLALTHFDVIVTGDIGCYSLGVFPPLSRTDALLCMGAGFTLAHGMQKGGESRHLVGVVGDSTFFHSGITGLMDVVYNQGTVKLVVLDNRITAMTGHQDHPGTGVTLMGTPTKAASIEAIAKACGIEQLFVVNPYDQATLVETFQKAFANDEPALIISRAPCPLHAKKRVSAVRAIDDAACKNCHACLKCGCPAIECQGKSKPSINPLICMGCSLCQSLCKFDAIHSVP